MPLADKLQRCVGAVDRQRGAPPRDAAPAAPLTFATPQGHGTVLYDMATERLAVVELSRAALGAAPQRRAVAAVFASGDVTRTRGCWVQSVVHDVQDPATLSSPDLSTNLDAYDALPSGQGVVRAFLDALGQAGVAAVPVRDAAGRVWDGKVPAADLAQHAMWGFRRVRAGAISRFSEAAGVGAIRVGGEEEEVFFHESAVVWAEGGVEVGTAVEFAARVPQVAHTVMKKAGASKPVGMTSYVLMTPARGRQRAEWWLKDVPAMIVGMLGDVVAHPFQDASWGLSLGRPLCRLPARAAVGTFAVPDCSADPEAPPPPGWTADPSKRLRPAQLRALHWMMQRELDPAAVVVDAALRVVPPFQVDVALRYSVRGGVLADRTGHGKTATLLGLVAAHAPAFSDPDPFAPSGAETRQHFDLTATTLVVAPQHLMMHWAGEVAKFLPGAAVRVCAARAAPTLAGLQACDVVCVSYDTVSFLPLLQRCLWRRVVLDEFHQATDALLPRECVAALRALQARTRWGLTAAPNVRGCTGVQSTADLLRVDLLIPPGEEHSQGEADRCQAFVSAFIRQNGPAPTVDHVVPVSLTPAERIQYVSMRAALGTSMKVVCLSRAEVVGSVGIKRGRGGPGVLAQLRGAFETAVERAEVRGMLVLEVLRRRDKTFPVPAGIAQAFLTMASTGEEGSLLQSCGWRLASQWERLVHASDGFIADAWEAHAAALKQAPVPYIEGDAWSEELWRHDVADVAAAAVQDVIDIHRLFDFTWKTLRAFDAAGAAKDCAVCLKTEAEGLRAWSLLPCGHIYCTACTRRLPPVCMACRRCRCPMCRAPFVQGKVLDAAPEAQQLQLNEAAVRDLCAAAARAAGDPSPVEWSQYGSKLKLMCEALREVKRDDPRAQVAIFSQSASLLLDIGHALRALGPQNGGGRATGNETWDGAFVLNFRKVDVDEFTRPQAIRCDASFPDVELHLVDDDVSDDAVAASCVFFAHPFYGHDAAAAAAYEQRALDRVRRVGAATQKLPVFRFVTSGTVEAALHAEREALP